MVLPLFTYRRTTETIDCLFDSARDFDRTYTEYLHTLFEFLSGMSYYDVDAILTDSQKLPCTFELDVPGLGYLDGNPGQTVSMSGLILRKKITILDHAMKKRT